MTCANAFCAKMQNANRRKDDRPIIFLMLDFSLVSLIE
jgi:hypothetical protein